MAVLCLTIMALIASIDLGMKWWVEKKIEPKKDRKILGECLILRKLHNKGAMMGLGAKYPKVIQICSSAVTIMILAAQFVLAEKPGHAKEKIGLALISGGAISNTVDRIYRKYVVDYVAFNSKNKNVSKVTYNLGDFAVFAGGILLVISALLNTKE